MLLSHNGDLGGSLFGPKLPNPPEGLGNSNSHRQLFLRAFVFKPLALGDCDGLNTPCEVVEPFRRLGNRNGEFGQLLTLRELVS